MCKEICKLFYPGLIAMFVGFLLAGIGVDILLGETYKCACIWISSGIGFIAVAIILLKTYKRHDIFKR
jgi:TctA family transporter